MQMYVCSGLCMLDGEGSTSLHGTDKCVYATFVHVGLSRAVSHYASVKASLS